MTEENQKKEDKKQSKPKDAFVERIKIADAKDFKDFVTALNAILDEANLMIDKNGIKVQRMDNSGVGMVLLSIPKKYFSEWKIKTYGKIGISLDTLKDAFKKVKGGTQLEINTIKKNIGTDNKALKLSFKGKEGPTKLEIPYVEIGDRFTREPEVKDATSFTLNGEELKDISHSIYGKKLKYFTIEATKGKIDFSAKGDLVNYDKSLITKDTSITKPITSTFNIDFFDKFLKAAKDSSIITLHMGTDVPASIEYSIGPGTVKYWLAPFIDDIERKTNTKKSNSEKPSVPESGKKRLRA